MMNEIAQELIAINVLASQIGGALRDVDVSAPDVAEKEARIRAFETESRAGMSQEKAQIARRELAALLADPDVVASRRAAVMRLRVAFVLGNLEAYKNGMADCLNKLEDN